MTTKHIDGTYAGGYALNPKFQTLDIGRTGVVGGPGVTTGATAPSTVENAGTVSDILLGAGGLVRNAASGSIPFGITVSAGSGILVNDGTIGVAVGNYGPPAIYLKAGGAIINGTSDETTATISEGVLIQGAAGTVINKGTVIGQYKYYVGVPGFYFHSSINLADGGTVLNGSEADRTADLVNGVSVAGNAGTIVNFGMIGGETNAGYPFSRGTGVSIGLNDGGTVVNGSATDTAARISAYTSGILVGGATGTVVNFGAIEATGAGQTYDEQTGVRLGDGGLVTNGSLGDTTASIVSLAYGVDLRGPGTVVNFGVIAAIGGIDQPADGIDLRAAALVTNGAVGDTAALIEGGDYGIATGTAPVTIVNFGTIGGGYESVRFGASHDLLVTEAHAVFGGPVAGDAGTLELGAAAGAGALTGLGTVFNDFAVMTAVEGAAWSLTGGNTLGAKGHLVVADTLVNTGSLTLGDEVRITATGQFTNAGGAALIVAQNTDITAPRSLGFQVINAGTIDLAAGRLTLAASLINAGAIAIAVGAVVRLEGDTNSLAGAISGPGTLSLVSGRTVLDSGLEVAASHWTIADATAVLTEDLVYGGALSTGTGAKLVLGGRTLSLAAGSVVSLTGAGLSGAGVIVTDGRMGVSATTVAGPIQWLNGGTLTATGALTLGDSHGHTVVFSNQAGGVFNLAADTGIAIGSSMRSRFDNDGLLEKTGGSGISVVDIALVNRGTIDAALGTLDLANAVTGTGSLEIATGATLEAGGAVAAGQTADFAGAATLVLDHGALFAGRLSGFGAGDRLDLRDFGADSSLSFSGTKTAASLAVTDGGLSARIRLLGQYTAAGFALSGDGGGGAILTYAPPVARPLAVAS